MNGVLGGLLSLVAVIGIGWLVGRSGSLGAGAGGVLARASYVVATPALLFLTLAEADTGVLLSVGLVASAGSAALVALLYATMAWWRWRLPAAGLVPGALSSSYVNAGNLGIPVSAYVLGDASWVAPVLLFQVLVMAPVGLAVLAGSRPPDGTRPSRWDLLTRPVRTPVAAGCVLGLAAAAIGFELPAVLLPPVELTASLAVPAALLAYGMSLHGAPRPASGPVRGQVWLAVLLKTLVQPAVAYALGRWAAGLDGPALLAVTVTSALPTAHVVFVYASSHDTGTGTGTVLVRDAVLLSTVVSVPVLIGLAALLG